MHNISLWKPLWRESSLLCLGYQVRKEFCPRSEIGSTHNLFIFLLSHTVAEFAGVIHHLEKFYTSSPGSSLRQHIK